MSSSQTRRQKKCTRSASPLDSATAEVEPDKKQNLFFTSWTNGSVWTTDFESARGCTCLQPFSREVFYFPAMATVQVRGSENSVRMSWLTFSSRRAGPEAVCLRGCVQGPGLCC